MAPVTVKRNVLLRSVVTEGLRKELGDELQSAADEIDDRLQQLDFQTKAYITDLQRTNLQQAMTVRKQVETERKRQEELRDALLERKAQMQELEDGSEVVRGTLESFVDIDVGDDLTEVLGGMEILTKDNEVIEIRRVTTLEAQGSMSEIIAQARSQEQEQGSSG